VPLDFHFHVAHPWSDLTIYALGGVPIRAGDQLIGAAPVSGAPGGERDVTCANAGLAKAADKLK
jgi:uncharacterized protein GlcG (DUF336 family)